MKKTKFEKYLKDNTLVVGKNLKVSSKSPFDFRFERSQEMKGGMHSYVTRVWSEGKSWAIKEGRTDLSVPLLENIDIPLDRNFWSMFIGPLGYDIMPTTDRIAKDLREYFLIAKYFGYFKDNQKVLGDNQFIRKEQKKLRKELKDFYKKESDISSLIWRLIGKKEEKMKLLKEVIKKTDIVNYNFLVKEYVILSKPKKAKYEKTFYIVQEWAEGYTLQDFLEEDFTKKTYGRLIVFLILALHLFEQEQKVIDTRGGTIMNTNWFINTENIIVNPETEEVKFIDTRSLWDLTGTFAEKGIFSSDMLLHSLITSFNDFLENYKAISSR
ncbi:hypothetical protein JW796_01840 [Candidatus Dojkabacteria bacterium]|nr:hypothetical protein [Candidatus Dojkabacteria bacterium]